MKGNTGIRRIILAFGYTGKGLKAAFLNESAFRQELLLALVLTPASLWFNIEPLERLLLIGVLFLVLIVELLNSGIEAVVDRIGPEHHDLSGRAKDLGSAAVFLSCVLAFITWGTVLWPLF